MKKKIISQVEVEKYINFTKNTFIIFNVNKIKNIKLSFLEFNCSSIYRVYLSVENWYK